MIMITSRMRKRTMRVSRGLRCRDGVACNVMYNDNYVMIQCHDGGPTGDS